MDIRQMAEAERVRKAMDDLLGVMTRHEVATWTALAGTALNAANGTPDPDQAQRMASVFVIAREVVAYKMNARRQPSGDN